MSGIYIHIPFCKQACSYCDFHFSTKMTSKAEMIKALSQELEMRKGEMEKQSIGSIYLGGGTPSVLSAQEIEDLIEVVFTHYQVSTNAEITLEANPDDLSKSYLAALSKTKLNRLSIGVQSFHESDLVFMNRAHNAAQALEAMHWIQSYFDNVSIDLIYGVPGLGVTPEAQNAKWEENIKTVLRFNPKHISAYALTVEPQTYLAHQIKQGKLLPLDEQRAAEQYQILRQTLKSHGYDHYEFSNFSKPGFKAVNNTAYWEGKSYIGIGPSAHSFDGKSRSWNISSNPLYLREIALKNRPFTAEQLSLKDRYNEYIMTGLRTSKGIHLDSLAALFGNHFKQYALTEAQEKIKEGSLELIDQSILRVSAKGLFFTDGLAAHLFYAD